MASGVDSGKVIWYQIKPANPPHIVVISPDFPLSTAKARQVLPKTVPLADAVHNTSRTAFLLHCFASGDYRHLRFAMEDRLHQIYRAKRSGLNDVIDACYEAGHRCRPQRRRPAVIAFVDRAGTKKTASSPPVCRRHQTRRQAGVHHKYYRFRAWNALIDLKGANTFLAYFWASSGTSPGSCHLNLVGRGDLRSLQDFLQGIDRASFCPTVAADLDR